MKNVHNTDKNFPAELKSRGEVIIVPPGATVPVEDRFAKHLPDGVIVLGATIEQVEEPVSTDPKKNKTNRQP
jgi:hypothetical protein